MELEKVINKIEDQIKHVNAKVYKILDNDDLKNIPHKSTHSVSNYSITNYHLWNHKYYLDFNSFILSWKYSKYLDDLFHQFSDQIHEYILSQGSVLSKVEFINEIGEKLGYSSTGFHSNKYNDLSIHPSDKEEKVFIYSELINKFEESFNKTRKEFIEKIRIVLKNLYDFLEETRVYLSEYPDLSIVLDLIPSYTQLLSDLTNPFLYFKQQNNLENGKSEEEIMGKSSKYSNDIYYFNNHASLSLYKNYLEIYWEGFKHDFQIKIQNSQLIPTTIYFFIKKNLYYLSNTKSNFVKKELDPMYFDYDGTDRFFTYREDIKIIDESEDEEYYWNTSDLIHYYTIQYFLNTQKQVLSNLISFLESNLNFLSSKKLTKIWDPLEAFDRKLNSNGKKNKEPKKIPNSYTFRYWNEKEYTINSIYNSLVEANFINIKLIKESEFRNIFKNKKPKKKLQWSGTIEELVFFIKLMHRKYQLIETLHHTIWKVTASIFIDQDMNELDYSKLANQHPPKSANQLEEIVRFYSDSAK